MSRASSRTAAGSPLDTYRSRDGGARPRTEARGGRRDHAGAQRPASGASGFDRIVGVMSASGSYDTVPSNWGRGATVGPPACSGQSSPVVFRAHHCRGLQGLIASWHDWRRLAASLIRKRSQVRVLDRPLPGNPCRGRVSGEAGITTQRRIQSSSPSASSADPWGNATGATVVGRVVAAPNWSPRSFRSRRIWSHSSWR
jgi:hypothetical protein